MTRLFAVLREPLAQFLLIGAVIAALYGLLPSNAEPVQDDVILVSEGQVEQLTRLFERTWNRPPTEAESAGLVDSFVRDEILFRNGTELGLADDDMIVRRRIVQKMSFLLEPDPDQLAPTDEDLEAYLEANREGFRIEPQLAFEQVFFDESRHGNDLDAVIATARVALDGGAALERIGDNTLLPSRFDLARIGDIERQLGGDFAAALQDLPVGDWSGPVRSPFGIHLIRVRQSEPARDPALDEVRNRLTESWKAQERDRLAEARYEELANRFEVVREDPNRRAVQPE